MMSDNSMWPFSHSSSSSSTCALVMSKLVFPYGVNWKRDSGVFFSPFLGQWPMFVLARFIFLLASLCLPPFTLIRFLFGPKKNIRGGSRTQQVSPYDGTRSILI